MAAQESVPPADLGVARSRVLNAISTLQAPVQRSRAALVDELTAAALAGRPLPTDIVERIAADQAMLQAADEARAVLGEVIQRVNGMAKQQEAQLVPERLRAMDRRVHEVQAAVAELLPQLGSVRSATAAMRAGEEQMQAWRTLMGLGDEYARIRLQQGVLTTQAEGTRVVINAELIAKFGIMRNATQVWPERVAATIGRSTPPPPWPHPKDQPWQISHSLDFLIWAAQAKAELWVPTPEQLELAFRENAAAATELRSEDGPRRNHGAAA